MVIEVEDHEVFYPAIANDILPFDYNVFLLSCDGNTCFVVGDGGIRLVGFDLFEGVTVLDFGDEVADGGLEGEVGEEEEGGAKDGGVAYVGGDEGDGEGGAGKGSEEHSGFALLEVLLPGVAPPGP